MKNDQDQELVNAVKNLREALADERAAVDRCGAALATLRAAEEERKAAEGRIAAARRALDDLVYGPVDESSEGKARSRTRLDVIRSVASN